MFDYFEENSKRYLAFTLVDKSLETCLDKIGQKDEFKVNSLNCKTACKFSAFYHTDPFIHFMFLFFDRLTVLKPCIKMASKIIKHLTNTTNFLSYN